LTRHADQRACRVEDSDEKERQRHRDRTELKHARDIHFEKDERQRGRRRGDAVPGFEPKTHGRQ
jgi:hypothetical protein